MSDDESPVIFNYVDVGCHMRWRMEQHIRPKLNSRWKWWWNTETPPSNRTKCPAFIFDDTHFAFRIWQCSTLIIQYTACCCYCCHFIWINAINCCFSFRNIFSNANDTHFLAIYVCWARSQWKTWNNTKIGIHWSFSFFQICLMVRCLDFWKMFYFDLHIVFDLKPQYTNHKTIDMCNGL